MTHAAAIRHGTLPEQRCVVSTLGALASDVERNEFGSRVIGDVVGLAAPAQTVELRSAP